MDAKYPSDPPNPPSYSDYYGNDPQIPTYTHRDEKTVGITSSAVYFQENPPRDPRPHNLIPYRLPIDRNSNSKTLPFPQPEQIFQQRGLSPSAWSTFLTRLFPTHSASNAHEKSTLLYLGDGMNAALQNAQTIPPRRQYLDAVLQDWNAHFFLPRGLLIIAQIQAPRIDPAIATAPSPPCY